MMAASVHSKRKWFPVLAIGFSLLFFAALAMAVMYGFYLTVFRRHEAPNWGILGFGLAVGLFAVYLFMVWIPNLTTLKVDDEKIVETGLSGRKVILFEDIVSINLDDMKEVKALWVRTNVPCATIRSAEQTISFMYDNYNNGEEIGHALKRIAHRKKFS